MDDTRAYVTALASLPVPGAVCPHCGDPVGLVGNHHDGEGWVCPPRLTCQECGGTILPPTLQGAPRGTCHCPANVAPVPGSPAERRRPCMLPP
jgi:hypothetical protein